MFSSNAIRPQSLSTRLAVAAQIQMNIIGDVDDPTIPWSVSRIVVDDQKLIDSCQRMFCDYSYANMSVKAISIVFALYALCAVIAFVR